MLIYCERSEINIIIVTIPNIYKISIKYNVMFSIYRYIQYI